MLRFLLFIFLFFSTQSLLAHNVKPAYLSIEEQKNNTYNILWKVPILEGDALTIRPMFPKKCKKTDENNSYILKSDSLNIMAWSITCEENLIGKSISIENIENDVVDVLIELKKGEKSYFLDRFTATNATIKIKEENSLKKIIQTYTQLGIKHILLGFDHLLFVLGLMLIIFQWKELIKTITAFTLAHSITLGLTITGYVHLPSIFIEVMIALSIMVLAVEIIYSEHKKYGLSSKYPWSVAFMFGLLHGFGFASVLTELGLPQESVLLALLFFNIGIEVGQLLFIALILFFYFTIKKVTSTTKQNQGKLLLTYLIGITASYWFIERLHMMIGSQ